MVQNKNHKLFKLLGVSFLAISTAVAPLALPVSAQVVEPGVEPAEEIYDDDDGFDWGWLGLIGLFGLAGLAGKGRRRNDATAYREPDSVRTGYRD